MLMLAARRNRTVDKDLALLLGTHSVRKQKKTVVNKDQMCKRVQTCLNLQHLHTRRAGKFCFSHDDLAWHENEAILKHKSYNVRKIKANIEAQEITHVTWRAGKPLSRQLKPSRKNSCINECIDEERERVTKTGEETMVESFYPAGRETFYCGLLCKNMKNIAIHSFQ